jgi:hypothetical protein
MNVSATRVSDYYDFGGVSVMTSPFYSRPILAYNEYGKGLVMADKYDVDDEFHQQYYRDYPNARDIDDLSWREFRFACWLRSNRDYVINYIKEHQLKEEDFMDKNYWRGVEGVTISDDGLWLSMEGIDGRAHYNLVDNTLYQMCVDDKSVKFADDDESYHRWCRDHSELVIDTVEHFIEDEKKESTDCSISESHAKVLAGRFILDISICDGKSASAEFIQGSVCDSGRLIVKIPLNIFSDIMKERQSLGFMEYIHSEIMLALSSRAYTSEYTYYFAESVLFAGMLVMYYDACVGDCK